MGNMLVIEVNREDHDEMSHLDISSWPLLDDKVRFWGFQCFKIK